MPFAELQQTPVDRMAMRVANSRAWNAAPSHIADAAGKFLMLDTTIADAQRGHSPLAYGSRIVMANAEHGLELRIAIGTDVHSGKGLAMHIFGADDTELAADMVGELGNLFMGALKAAFSNEGFGFAAGLPETLPTDQLLRPSITYAHQEAFTLVAGDATLVVHLGVRSRGNQVVWASGLREGMVIATDVHNVRGVMLVGRGARLSQNMIEGLRLVLPQKSAVEVMAQ